MTAQGRDESGPRSTFLRRPADSVLAGLRMVRGSAPRVLLRDLPDVDTPVIQPLGQDGPRRPDGPWRYQVLGEIGRGGVGVVVKGRDSDLGRDVAMKHLRAEHTGNRELVQRFIEEAQIEAQLQHPGIVPVYDLGLLATEGPFFAMKLVKGQTLGGLLRRRRDPTDDRPAFLRIFEKVSQTVAYAHDRGVIHRDLKPGNVLVGAFGEVLVVDWGFAKVLGREEGSQPGSDAQAVRTLRTDDAGSDSRAGSILGTPAYMAPEQARGRLDEIDARADVFALGAILCEILTGRPPYPRDTERALVAAAAADLDEAYARIATCDAEEELAALARACLGRDAAARPADAGAVARAVTAYLTSAEDRARAAGIARAESDARALADRRTRRLTAVLASAVLAAVLVAGGAWFVRERQLETRVQETRERVSEALAAAQRQWGAAQEAAVTDLVPWETAERAVRATEATLRAGTPDDETRQRVATMRNAVAREAAAARAAAQRFERDETMKARLEEIRIRRSRTHVAFDWSEAAAEAFRSYGIDVEALAIEDAAARIRESRIAPELVAALDTWAVVVGGYGREPVPELGRRLAEIARHADGDPIRQRLRRAMLDQDLETLRGMAREPDDTVLATNAANLLAHTLAALGDPEGAMAFLRLAIRRRPDRAGLHLQLATHLLGQEPPRVAEGIAHLRATLAVHPDDADALTRLSDAAKLADERAARGEHR